MSRTNIRLTQKWVLPLTFLFFFTLLVIIAMPMLRLTGGMVIYPQDEGYIHMAIAKNLVFHKVWGLSSYEFNSASSSLLYPILIAVFFKIFGLAVSIPLWINLVAAVLFVIVLQKWLQRQDLTPLHQLVILWIIIYLTPLHFIVITGMEHTLQVLLSFIFIFKFCEWLYPNENSAVVPHRFPVALLVYGVLLTALRYEGLFLVATACVMLLFDRRWGLSLVLLLTAILPPVIYGIYSLYHGGYFLPNSILIKDFPLPFNDETIERFFTQGAINKLFYPYSTRGGTTGGRLLILLPLVYCTYLASLKQSRQYKAIISFCLVMTILHMIFADSVPFYRYTAYLLACGLVVPLVLAVRYKGPWLNIGAGAVKWMIVWVFFFLLQPMVSRSWDAFETASLGFHHEYEQNYMAARLLREHFNDKTVIMDELGAACFYSDGRKLDINKGIAYMKVAETKMEGFGRLDYMDMLIKQERPILALVADKDYHPWLRRNWVKVTTWYTTAKVVLGNTQLSIYAVDTVAMASVRSGLRMFDQSLPQQVKAIDP